MDQIESIMKVLMDKIRLTVPEQMEVRKVIAAELSFLRNQALLNPDIHFFETFLDIKPIHRVYRVKVSINITTDQIAVEVQRISISQSVSSELVRIPICMN